MLFLEQTVPPAPSTSHTRHYIMIQINLGRSMLNYFISEILKKKRSRRAVPVNKKKNTEHLTVKGQVQNVKDRRTLGDFTIVYTIHFPKESRPGVSFSVSPIILPS